MKKPVFALVVAAAFSAIAPLARSSTLYGSQVTLTSYYPNLSTPITIPDTQTVGPTIEFPSGSITTINGIPDIGENIDVRAASIDFTYTEDATGARGLFNGDVFEFNSTGPVITGVSVDPSSTFNASQIGLSFGQHDVMVDESGLTVTTSSQLLVDIDFATTVTTTPEPRSGALLLAGLGLVAFASWRKAKACAG